MSGAAQTTAMQWDVSVDWVLLRNVEPIGCSITKTSGPEFQSRHPTSGAMGYSQATPVSQPVSEEPALERQFQALAQRWHQETDHFSNIVRKAMSPAYQEIIGMGEKAIPLILRDLETKGGHWFWALRAIARHDAAAGTDNYDDAVRAWLEWGSSRGYRQRVRPTN